jgi:hypothetical protein
VEASTDTSSIGDDDIYLDTCEVSLPPPAHSAPRKESKAESPKKRSLRVATQTDWRDKDDEDESDQPYDLAPLGRSIRLRAGSATASYSIDPWEVPKVSKNVEEEQAAAVAPR